MASGTPSPPGLEVIGREGELSRLRDFVLGDRHQRVVVLSGGAGVGKTTLWEAALAAASERGAHVLSAQAAEAETTLPFATLSDLFQGIEIEAGPSLPEPQRRALDVALLRAEPAGAPAEARAIALGVLSVLRSLSIERPVLVAIDDLQWTDAASMKALAFAARRLNGESVRIMLARRPGRPTPLEQATAARATGLVVDGLSLGAVRRLLTTRLELVLSRRVVRQVFEATLGNPLFALELGRTLAEVGPPAIGEELVLPDSLDELLGARVNGSSTARRARLAVALGGGLTVSELVELVGDEPLEAAIERGLLLEDEGRLRPAHPLLAAALLKRVRARERRDLHRALAKVVSEPARRARHLALAETRPDAALARTVAAGASGALARGATEQAVELAEHALRLTPPGAADRHERVLELAGSLELANEVSRLKDLLELEFDSLPPGPPRARGHLIWASTAPASQEDYEYHLERAIAEGESAPELRARALAAQSLDSSMAWLERLDEADFRAREALRLAPTGPAAVEAVHAVAWGRIVRGRPIDDLRLLLADEGGEIPDLRLSLERLSGIRLACRGSLHAARAVYARELARAEEHGQEEARSALHHQLCELELRAGAVATATRLVEDLDRVEAMVVLGMRSHTARLLAVAAAIRGDQEDTEHWATRTEELIAGQRWDLLEVGRARGIAALAAHDSARATAELLGVWQHTETEGIEEPGIFPVAPDLVEAALGIGDIARAREVTARLAELADRQEHPWGLASVRRCNGLLELATDGDGERARVDLLGAAEAYGSLGLRFDEARTLLGLGRHARRRRKWAVARDALERAAATFGELGCDGWASQAREELSSVGGRRPRDAATLTPTEQRVAELASRGSSNKEIAQTLFVTVHTVEVHLSHAYAKLGVRSRAQLSGRLAASG